jgi:hypothetical protein
MIDAIVRAPHGFRVVGTDPKSTNIDSSRQYGPNFLNVLMRARMRRPPCKGSGRTGRLRTFDGHIVRARGLARGVASVQPEEESQAIAKSPL